MTFHRLALLLHLLSHHYLYAVMFSSADLLLLLSLSQLFHLFTFLKLCWEQCAVASGTMWCQNAFKNLC